MNENLHKLKKNLPSTLVFSMFIESNASLSSQHADEAGIFHALRFLSGTRPPKSYLRGMNLSWSQVVQLTPTHLYSQRKFLYVVTDRLLKVCSMLENPPFLFFVRRKCIRQEKLPLQRCGNLDVLHCQTTFSPGIHFRSMENAATRPIIQILLLLLDNTEICQ